MSARAQVVCVGGATIDHVLEIDAIPSGEGKQAARDSRWSGGGVAATAAVAVVALGGRAAWCGLIGDDAAGVMLTGMFDEAGVRVCEKAVVPGGQTPIAAVLVDPEGRRWLGWHGGSGLGVDESPPQLPDLSETAAMVADQWSIPMSVAAFQAARERGIPRVLDFEMADRAGAADLAALADHVVFSAEGLADFGGAADVEVALATAARRLPCATVGATLGPDGSAWIAEGRISYVPAPKLAARDTTGCGDVFHGAYALALAEGQRHPAAFATAAAALKAERGNGWAGMPSRADTETLLAKGWT